MNITRKRGDGDTFPVRSVSGLRKDVEGNGAGDVLKETNSTKVTEGQLVYVRDTKEGWTPAVVCDVNEKNVTVWLENGLTQYTKPADLLLRSEDCDFLECDNLTDVTPINEASVLECLHQRFLHEIFYTAAGTTIVAINPFRDIPTLYNIHKIQEYHTPITVLSPHIYIIAEKAYTHMVRQLGKVDQTIVVSGESGAGKTVSAKHLLRYLTIVSSPEQEINLEDSIPGSVIERRVLVSNPILEAFGNAATPRNENSSRFGKFIQLQFHRNGYILGGVIQTYLLEKTRVVHQGVGENNFHIFYQLLSLEDMPSIPTWLEEIRTEVKNSRLPHTVPQQAETLSVLQTVEAMSDIGITPSTQVSIFKVLLAILHLSVLKLVSSKDNEASSMSDDEASIHAKEECSRLLGISPLSLHHVLLNRNIVSGRGERRSVFVKPVGVAESRSRRDCLSMLLYSRLFDWMVTFINIQIEASHFDQCINLLDIYGFETFDVNGLEQLCINYANERLQQHYVAHFLRDLQMEYESEHIPWISVSYRDNRMCVDTLDGSAGVFGVLNEEVYLNRKSPDTSLSSRIVDSCGSHGGVRKPHFGTYGNHFLVCHYAGEVLYSVEGAVTKNKDNIPEELMELMNTSSNAFILNLFSEEEFTTTEPLATCSRSMKKKTVLTKFKSSLDSLMSSLEQSDVHYIRCIKPNTQNRPDRFDRQYVLSQLQACGTLETVDICRMGYPARMTYKDFVCRYGVFMRLSGQTRFQSDVSPGEKKNEEEYLEQNKENVESFYQKVEARLSHPDSHHHFRHTSPKKLRRRSGGSEREVSHKLCASILIQVFPFEDLQKLHLQFGLLKVFLTQKQLEHLEHTRAILISRLVSQVQATWLGFVQRKHFQKMKAMAVIIQSRWRGWRGRRNFCQTRHAAVRIQKASRAHRLKQAIKRLVRSLRIIKRSLGKWAQRRRFQVALRALREQKEKDIFETRKGLSPTEEGQSSRANTTDYADLYTDSQDTMFDNVNSTDISENFDHTEREDEPGDINNDLSGHWSDDSGVMIKDDLHHSPAGEVVFEGPPKKKQKLALRSDLRMGNGIITCRRLTRPGFRFHVKRSVVKHGHVIHNAELPKGLPDVLRDTDRQSHDSSHQTHQL